MRARVGVLTAFGIASATVMIASYRLENRGPAWVMVFAVGCASTALYAVLTRSWIFAALEAIWSVIALRRFTSRLAHGDDRTFEPAGNTRCGDCPLRPDRTLL